MLCIEFPCEFNHLMAWCPSSFFRKFLVQFFVVVWTLKSWNLQVVVFLVFVANLMDILFLLFFFKKKVINMFIFTWQRFVFGWLITVFAPVVCWLQRRRVIHLGKMPQSKRGRPEPSNRNKLSRTHQLRARTRGSAATTPQEKLLICRGSWSKS